MTRQHLPVSDGIEPTPGTDNPPIDAVDWVIPEAVMDLDLAIGGLMRLEETRRNLVEQLS